MPEKQLLVVNRLLVTNCATERAGIKPEVTILFKVCVHQLIASCKFFTSGSCGSDGNVRRGMAILTDVLILKPIDPSVAGAQTSQQSFSLRL